MTPVAVWVRKDLRRFAPWVVAWIVLLAVRAVAGAEDALPWVVRMVLEAIPALVVTVLFVLLATLVVHEDPAVDPKAFWPTRAVSARQLVASKLLFVWLVLVLPVTAAETCEVAMTGAEWRIVALAALEGLLDWSVWGAVAVLLAALTTSLPGFIAAAAALVAFGCVAWLSTAPVLTDLLAMGELSTRSVVAAVVGPVVESLRARGPAAPPPPTQELTLTVLAVVVALLITARTYARRSRAAGGAMVGAGVLGLAFLAAYWPVHLAPAVAPPAPVAERTLQITVDPVRAHAVGAGRRAGSSDMQIVVESHLSIPGVEPPHAIEIETLTVVLAYADRRFHHQQPVASSWNRRVVERLLDGARIVNDDIPAQDTIRSYIPMPAGTFAQRRTEFGQLAVDAIAAVRRYVVAGSMPLEAGAAMVRHGERLVIHGVVPRRDELVVDLRGARVSLLLAPSRSTIVPKLFFRQDRDTAYVLRNRRRREALVMMGDLMGTGAPWPSRLDRVSWWVVFPLAGGESPVSLPDDFLRDADLVRIEATTVETAHGRTSVDAVGIDPSETPRDPGAPSPRSFSDAEQPEVPDEPSIAFATLSDEALMSLDWYGPTRRDAGMTVTATRDVPGPGIEIDVAIDASPTRGARPVEPAPPAPGGVEGALQRARAEAAIRAESLYFLSSAFGGTRALAGLDLRDYDALYLHVTLVRIDGRPPDDGTPLLKIGVVAGDTESTRAETPLAPPDWSAAVWGDPMAPGEPGDRGLAREIGLVVLPDDRRWAGRAARLTLRVEPIEPAVALRPTRASVRRATLSPAVLGSIVADHGRLVRREPSGAGAIDLDLELDRGTAFVRLPDDVAARVRRSLRGFDVLEVQATILAIDGEPSECAAVMFAGGAERPLPMLSPTHLHPSAVVSRAADATAERLALRVVTGAPGATWGGPRPRALRLRLAPSPGARRLP